MTQQPSSRQSCTPVLGKENQGWGFDSLDPQQLATSVDRLSPASLAYLGDAVYELYIRQYYLFPPRRIAQYHDLVVSQVRAERQAVQLQFLLPQLTEEELTILRRGRNAANRGPQRLAPEIYQQATSLETLVGYLYVTNRQRLQELLSQLQLD